MTGNILFVDSKKCKQEEHFFLGRYKHASFNRNTKLINCDAQIDCSYLPSNL